MSNESPFVASSTLIKVASFEGVHLHILLDNRMISDAIRDPSTSPWTHRFEARTMCKSLLNVSFSIVTDREKEADRFLRMALSLSGVNVIDP